MTTLLKTTLLLIACFPLAANAALVSSTKAKIAEVIMFADYGSGDVVVKLESSPAQCNGGFWVAMSSPGFSTLVAAVLAAMHAGTEVIISGHDDQIWGGSSANYCKVYNIKQSP